MLYIYSLFVLVLIFIVAFGFFVKYINNSLCEVRYLISVFKIEYILEN
jgi:hypothetical protein